MKQLRGAIKKLLGNRLARLILTVLLLLTAATLVVMYQRAGERRQARQEAAAAESKATISADAGGGTTVTYQVQEQRPSAAAEVAPAEARAKQESGEALILDVRDAQLFEARGRLKGAVNIPLAELPRRRGELPAGKLIITYAYAGIPGEAEAAKVAAAQLAGEYRTAVLKGDAGDWLEAGLPVELPKAHREKLEAQQKGKADVK